MLEIVKKNIVAYYVSIFVFEFVRSIPFGIEMNIYQDIFNFSIEQVFNAKKYGSLISFIFEIPTGIFADKFGRKLSFLISTSISSIAFLTLSFATSSKLIIVWFVLNNISITFYSGSLESMIVSQIKLKKIISEKNFFKISWFIKRIGNILGGCFGIIGIQHLINVKNIFFIASIVNLISFLIAKIGIKDINREIKKTKSYLTIIILSIIFSIALFLNFFISIIIITTTLIMIGIKYYDKKYIFIDKKIIFLFIILFCVFFVDTIFFFYWPVHMKKLGIHQSSFEYIFVYILFNSVMGIGNLISNKISKKIGVNNTLFTSVILLGMTTIAMISMNKNVFILWLTINELVRGIYQPIFSYKINQYIPNESRSFWLSTNSAIAKSTMTFSCWLSELILNNFFIETSEILTIFSLISIIFLIIVFFIQKNYKIKI